MADYIRRDIVLKIINTVNDTGRFAGYADYCVLFDEIDTMPVERSRWIPMNDGTYNAYCENCGHERGSKAWNKADYKYCPNCGVRMDGEQNE